MTNLTTYKQKKKLKVIIKELDEVLTLLPIIKKSLTTHIKYLPVRDIYLNIINNESLLKSSLDKYRKKYYEDQV